MRIPGPIPFRCKVAQDLNRKAATETPPNAASPFDNRRFEIQRRRMKALLALVAYAGFLVAAMNAASLYDLSAKNIDGETVKLDRYRGKVLLIVNVASECGYTPQYQGLQDVFEKYQAKGLVVLGFPCNQFGGQEPGTNVEIKQFCTTTFHVTFPLFDKVDVNGAGRHPVYAFLAGRESPFPGNIKWNFNKFLVGRDGKIVRRFDSSTEPDAAELKRALEAALAAASGS